MSDQSPHPAEVGSVEPAQAAPTHAATDPESEAHSGNDGPEPDDGISGAKDDVDSDSGDSDAGSLSSGSEAQLQAPSKSTAKKAGVITRTTEPCSHYTLRKRVAAPARLMLICSGRARSEGE